ncbi:MAG TPA: hypothetical protein VN633_08720 [Bryobacteraceae bacterium]|nr:hypothetical protein [Bryobacteraceae bacterium]
MQSSRAKLWSVLALVAPALFVASCRRHHGPQSIIRMSDLHTQNQLMSGFYSLEAGAWRWTGKTFQVSLKVPDGGGSKGAVLTLQGTVPPESLSNGQFEINSTIGDTQLAPQSFTKAGEVIYRAEVPPSALAQPIAVATFTVSSTHRVPGDERDLGMIASVISLRSK